MERNYVIVTLCMRENRGLSESRTTTREATSDDWNLRVYARWRFYRDLVVMSVDGTKSGRAKETEVDHKSLQHVWRARRRGVMQPAFHKLPATIY